MLVDDLCQTVYENWLPMASLSGNIRIPDEKLDAAQANGSPAAGTGSIP